MPRNTSGLKRTRGPGRPKGLLNKATVEAKALCAKLVDDQVYLERLKSRLLSGRLAPAMEQLIWHYAKGKPKDVLEVQSRGKLIQVVLSGKPTPEDSAEAAPEK